VDKIVAFFSLHPLRTRLETAPSNGAAGSWSALETAAEIGCWICGRCARVALESPIWHRYIARLPLAESA
jgi:hypothetical protein